MEKITYFAESDGISLEQMIRSGEFNMKTKHFHSQYEIFYIIEGKRVFFFNNRMYMAQKGDLILIDTNLIHMTKSISKEDTGHNRIILYVDNRKMEYYDKAYPSLHLVRFFHEHYGVYHLDEEQQEAFFSMYHSLQNEFDHKKRHYETAIELDIITYFIQLIRHVSIQANEVPQFANTGKYAVAYSVADFLSQNCETNMSLEDLSARFYLSKYYLCRTFKEVTGYTVTEYVNINRIQKAKAYLEETDLSISSIAHTLGYESVTYFERIFKSYMTISPLKYRKTLNTVTYTNKPMV